jgi:hypothetical protein
MMKAQYVIETKDDKVLIEVPKSKDANEERMNAFAKYFLDVIEEKVTLDKIGNIIMLHKPGQTDQSQWYPFRVVPLLWKMNILGTSHAIDNIVACLDVTRKEAKKMLKNCADKDADLIPLIEDLKLMEEGEN